MRSVIRKEVCVRMTVGAHTDAHTCVFWVWGATCLEFCEGLNESRSA